MEIHLRDLREDYIRLVNLVREEGRPVTVRGLATRELTHVTYTLDPAAPTLPVGIGRAVSLPFAAAETLDVIAGEVHSNYYDAAALGWRDVLIDSSDAAVRYAAYGPRLRDQLADVGEALIAASTTRSALLQVWQPADLRWPGDRPCTVSLQFLVRDHRLDLDVHMRSQDVWLGTPYDVFMWTQVQWTIARLRGLKVGTYVHHVGSLHFYERDNEVAEKMTTLSPYDTLEDVDLPRGLIVPVGAGWGAAATLAHRLLNFEHSEVDAWYVDQMGRIQRKLR